MRMSEKCHNNNSDNPLTSRRTDGGKLGLPNFSVRIVFLNRMHKYTWLGYPYLSVIHTPV